MSKIPFIIFPNYEAQVYGYCAARFFGKGRKIQVSNHLQAWFDCPEYLEETIQEKLNEAFPKHS